MALKAIIIGAIGTLVETSEYQRQGFNKAFDKMGLDWHWEKEPYKQMLSTTGGKNRLREYAAEQGTSLTDKQIAQLHADKSRFYQEIIREIGLRPRAGIAEMIQNAKAEGIRVIFAPDTNAGNIQSIQDALGNSLDYSDFEFVTDNTTVARRRPHPDLHQYILGRLKILPIEAIAIEDTVTSLQAPLQAGITSIATPGAYVQYQDFSQAAAIAHDGEIANIDWLRSQLMTAPEPTT